ncbi:MAG: hypothetical protein ABFS24_14905 [Pseudomonadota bacterium]
MAATRPKSKKRSGPSFIQLPHYVLQSKAWRNLTGWETKWLIDLLAQYKGSNNGDLSMPWSYLSNRGWASKDTANRARAGLLEAGWIVITRKGWKKIPTLYGVLMSVTTRLSRKHRQQFHSDSGSKDVTPVKIPQYGYLYYRE